MAQIAVIKGENEKAIMYLNLALEIDKKEIEKRIKNQPLFIVIQDKIIIPDESRKVKITLSKRDVKNNKHLEEMFNLVDALHGNSATTAGGGASYTEQKEEKQMEKEEEINSKCNHEQEHTIDEK